MSQDGDRQRADADNPYAKPAQDLPVAIEGDGRLGKIAGWIFIALGAFAGVKMILTWVSDRIYVDFVAVAMLVIGIGLLRRSDSARKFGIGCAGFYLVFFAIGGVVFWWLANTGNLTKGRMAENFPATPLDVIKSYALIPLYAALLWLLLNPRTRAAYQQRPTVTEYGEDERPRPMPPSDSSPPT